MKFYDISKIEKMKNELIEFKIGEKMNKIDIKYILNNGSILTEHVVTYKTRDQLSKDLIYNKIAKYIFIRDQYIAIPISSIAYIEFCEVKYD